MSKIIQFGETVEGYDIPVLNEREIRAGAGILFVLMFVAILTAILKQDFTLLKYAVTIFLTDILIRVLINPRYAPSLILGRWIVRKQTPEYVGAQQKKFAWIIGIVLAMRHVRAAGRGELVQPDHRADLPDLPDFPLLRDLVRDLHRLQGLFADLPGEGPVLPGRDL